MKETTRSRNICYPNKMPSLFAQSRFSDNTDSRLEIYNMKAVDNGYVFFEIP